MASRSRATPSIKALSASATPFMVLPSTMPNSGSAKRASYQGSGRMATVRAKSVTSMPAAMTLPVPRP